MKCDQEWASPNCFQNLKDNNILYQIQHITQSVQNRHRMKKLKFIKAYFKEKTLGVFVIRVIGRTQNDSK